jgi:DNA-directed RNA polymerase subunit RPC12/RpoP
MIKYQCHHCGNKLRIAEQYGGQAANCNSCGNAIIVPHIREETPPGQDSDRRTPMLERVISTILVEGISRSIYFLIGFGFAIAPLLTVSPFGGSFRISLDIAIVIGLLFAAGGHKFVDDYIRSLR